MRRAICKQPIKKFYFINPKEEIYKKYIYFLKNYLFLFFSF